MNIKKRFETSLILGLIFAILLSFCSFEASCKEIENKVLRLHILANSDDTADQALKLRVRDKILDVSDDVFANATSKQDAITYAKENLSKIVETAQKEVIKNGYDYTVSGEVCKAYFNTRVYDNFTLPAGVYDAVRIKIGAAKGKNWWCVMFPQVCISAAADISDNLTENAEKTVTNPDQYKVRFKVVEWVETAREKINSWF